MAKDQRAIPISDDWRFFKARTNLAVHKRQFPQWKKEAAILPCRFNRPGWEVIPYDKVNSLSEYLKSLDEVNIWLQNKFDLSLNQEAIDHLEKLEAKMLMYKMIKEKL